MTGLAASAPVFAALGDETRLRLVARLCTGGPMSIARLTSGSEVTRQAITKEARRSLDHISAQWDEGLGRLKAALE